VTTWSHSSKVVQQLLSQQNPHVPGNYFTEDFFRDQWEKQRKFEIDLNQKDREKKEEQAQFFERGEAMKTLAYVLFILILLFLVVAYWYLDLLQVNLLFLDYLTLLLNQTQLTH
jgi:hypothetical protein